MTESIYRKTVSNYREIIKKAKAAGISHFGLSKNQLEKLLNGEDIMATRYLCHYFSTENGDINIYYTLQMTAETFGVSLDNVTTAKELYQKILNTVGETINIVIKSPLKKS